MALVLNIRSKAVAKIVDSYIFAIAGFEAGYFGNKAVELLDGKHVVINWATVGYIALAAVLPPVFRILDAKFPVLTGLSNKVLAIIGQKAQPPVV